MDNGRSRPNFRVIYRNEAERPILRALVDLGGAVIAHHLGRGRILGVSAPATATVTLRRAIRARSAAVWRLFPGGLSTRSAAYALSALGVLSRWLIEPRYLLAHPFAGVKVGGVPARLRSALRMDSSKKWLLVKSIADGLEWSYGLGPDGSAAAPFRAGLRVLDGSTRAN